MSPAVALIVLIAALCHALWNTFLKVQPDRQAGLVVLLSTGSLIGAAGAVYYGAPPPQSWRYLAASVALHFAYNNLLVWCYRLGDISLVYPVLRGAAPPIAALAGFLWLAESPSLFSLLGILIISAAILCMIKTNRGDGKAIFAALLTAATIAAYSVVDAKGARVVGNAVQYLCWLLIFDAPLFLALIIARRRRRFSLNKIPRRYVLLAAGGGALSVLAYGLVIYAYTQAQVGAVTAMRETSVVFGALMGMFFLGETKSRQRIIGALLIVIGAALIVIHAK